MGMAVMTVHAYALNAHYAPRAAKCYGPFPTEEAAMQWASVALPEKVLFEIVPLDDGTDTPLRKPAIT
jgi:hypothetical protein